MTVTRISIKRRLQMKAVARGLVKHEDDLLVEFNSMYGYMVRLREVDSHWVHIGATLSAAGDRLEQMPLNGLE